MSLGNSLNPKTSRNFMWPQEEFSGIFVTMDYQAGSVHNHRLCVHAEIIYVNRKPDTLEPS